jgi:hypothetical protein
LQQFTERKGNLSTKTDLAEMRYELTRIILYVKGEILEAMDKRFDNLIRKLAGNGVALCAVAVAFFSIITLFAAKIGAGCDPQSVHTRRVRAGFGG